MFAPAVVVNDGTIIIVAAIFVIVACAIFIVRSL